MKIKELEENLGKIFDLIDEGSYPFGLLTDWEIDFINSLIDKLDTDYNLSKAQETSYNRIVAKLNKEELL